MLLLLLLRLVLLLTARRDDDSEDTGNEAGRNAAAAAGMLHRLGKDVKRDRPLLLASTSVIIALPLLLCIRRVDWYGSAGLPGGTGSGSSHCSYSQLLSALCTLHNNGG